MTRQANERLVLSVREAADLLGLSVRSTYTLCHRSDFPALQLTPNRIGISRLELEHWIAEQVGKGHD